MKDNYMDVEGETIREDFNIEDIKDIEVDDKR
jgi:hypothetical protein